MDLFDWLVGRHLLAYAFRFDYSGQDPSIPKTQHHAAAGFVAEVEGVWVLVTAGHILKAIESGKAGGMVVGYECRVELWGKKGQSLPLPCCLGDAVAVPIDQDGLDLGLVFFREHFRRLLEAGGTVPFSKEMLAPPEATFDAVVGLGLPDELQEVVPGGLSAPACLLSMDPCLPPEEMRTATPRFYARLKPDVELTLNSLSGMSGGPILGFKKTPEGTRYWLVGLQSVWRRDLRVIAAVPSFIIGKVLEACIDRLAAENWRVLRG